MSGKVQNANTHPLQCQSREHAHSSRSVQGPQFKGQWNVTQGSIRRKTHVALPQHTAYSERTSGAMDESARQLKRLAHISRSVRIHIGVGQRCYAIDAESSTLPGKASAALVTFQRGNG